MMFLSSFLKKAANSRLTRVLTINPRLRCFFKIVKKRETIRIKCKKLLNLRLEAIKGKVFLTPKLELVFMMLVTMKRIPKNLKPDRVRQRTIYY